MGDDRRFPLREDVELSAAHTSTCSSSAGVLVCGQGEVVVVALAGEIDLSSIAGVTQVVYRALQRRPWQLVLDMAQVSFCDVRGIRLITRTLPRETGRVEVGYSLAAVPALTAYLMDRFSGSVSPPPRHPSVDDALAALLDPAGRASVGADDARTPSPAARPDRPLHLSPPIVRCADPGGPRYCRFNGSGPWV